MIQLTISNPTIATLNHLRDKQADIDGQVGFPGKVDRADTLWQGKEGSQAGRTAFADVKASLVLMSASKNLCNYCETNEGTDVEHIYPKKLYPESAFQWNNYLLACGTCNTHYKSDQFAIFNPVASATKQEIPRQRGAYVQPANSDGAFINQRIEDPMGFLYLDIRGKTFHFSNHPTMASARDIEKAEYTRKILGLNTRAELVEARRTAAQYYLHRLQKYIQIRNAADFDQLNDVVADEDAVDETQPFANEQTRLLNGIKADIKGYRNPVVWREMKRQRGNLPKTGALFTRAPEALTW